MTSPTVAATEATVTKDVTSIEAKIKAEVLKVETALKADANRIEAWYIAELAKTYTFRTLALVAGGALLLGALIAKLLF